MRVFAALSVSASVLVTLPAAAGTDSWANSVVGEVTAHRFADGSPAGLGYVVRHEATQTMQPDQDFPSVRIDARGHEQAFEGQWADSGFHAAWIAPKGRTQFMPDAYSVESAYFDNYLSGDAQPMQPGDGADIAVKSLPADAILTWDRQRGDAAGEPEWEVATHGQSIDATYGGVSQTAEILFVRADLVVRGGDLDARDGMDLPPLVIDLGKTYGPEVNGSASTAAFAPYLHYMSGLEGQVLPQSGMAVFRARTRGYLPESRSYDLPGGTHIREWHIPLNIIITLTKHTDALDQLPGGSPFGARSMVQMPSGGTVWTTVGSETTALTVPPGSSATTGAGIDPLIVPDPGSSAASDGTQEPAEPAAMGITVAGGTLLDDVKAASVIDRDLDEPVRLEVGKRTFGFTVDPDFKGQGLLALRSFEHVRTGQSYFSSVAAPFVKVDGELFTLDRSRLVDLRVFPLIDAFRVRFTGRSDGSALDQFAYLKAREGRILRTGVVVEAVYRLTDDRFAFFTAYGYQDAASDNLPSIDTYLDVRSLTRSPAHASVVRYMETGSEGPVTVGGVERHNEFSEAAGVVETGAGSIRMATGGGSQLTAVRPSGPLVPDPLADPAISLEGAPVDLYLTSREGTTSWIHTGYMSSRLGAIPEEPAVPLPLDGEPCAPASIVDDAAADAPAHLDIERAWFDFDGRRLYATIQVASLPAESLGEASSYRASFRHEHIGFGMQADRDITGEWSYMFGLHPSAGSSMSTTTATEGEVVPGTPGLIRMSVPILSKFSGSGFLDGETLRDTGAVSYDVTPIGTEVSDRAPEGAAEYAFGRGGDYLISLCPDSITPVTLDLAGSPVEGQHSDEVSLQARLADHDGTPVAGRTLTFEIAGDQVDAITGEDGVARATTTLGRAPGGYELQVSFAGDSAHDPSTTSSPFTILQEDSAMTAEHAGRGQQRSLVISLFDQDSAEGIAGRSVRIYVDGEFVDAIDTDDDGRVIYELGPGYRGSNHSFEAEFLGDAYFLGSEVVI